LTKSLGNAAAGALVLGAAHALIDLACAFVLFRDLNAVGVPWITVAIWIITYDTLAFAGQAPLGLLIDRWRAYRSVSLVGIAAVAVALAVGPAGPRVASVIAGVGNALFHVGAGGHVLRASGSGATAIGFFVGPGAIGLCLGILFGSGQAPYRLAIAIALVIALVVVPWVMPRDKTRAEDRRDVGRLTLGAPIWLCLSLLLATVALRSTIGDNVVNDWRERSVAVVTALAIVATVGKMLGGLLADRLGWLKVGGCALLAAAPIVALERTSSLAALAGILLLQTTTPLTLRAIHQLVPDRPALAFGIPSAALLLGATPGLFDVRLLPVWPALLAAVLLSAVALIVGLRSAGYRQSIGTCS
jgi:MFS transporter, FSR family, fosmidomycin resistance protein